LTRTFKHRKRSTVVSWFKTHARLIWWHNVGDRSSRATPSGQQISAADTDAVFCVRIPFMIGDIAATSRISGAALLVLKNPGFGVPSGRPVYITNGKTIRYADGLRVTKPEASQRLPSITTSRATICQGFVGSSACF